MFSAMLTPSYRFLATATRSFKSMCRLKVEAEGCGSGHPREYTGFSSEPVALRYVGTHRFTFSVMTFGQAPPRRIRFVAAGDPHGGRVVRWQLG